jgi:hypothetical protein
LGSLCVQPALKLTAALDSSKRPGADAGVLLLLLLLLLLPLLLLPSPPPPPQETSMPASSKAATRLISRTTLHITDPSAPLGIVSVISKTLLRGVIIRMDLRGLTAPASNASGNQAVATGGE